MRWWRRLKPPYNLASNNRRYRPTFEFAAVERRVAAFRRRTAHIIRPIAVQAEDGYIRGVSRAQGPAVQGKYARRILREQPDQMRQIDVAGMIELLEREAERGLKPDNAEGTAFELLHLFGARVRRVIGRDGVDSAFDKPLFHGSTSGCSRSGGFIL